MANRTINPELSDWKAIVRRVVVAELKTDAKSKIIQRCVEYVAMFSPVSDMYV